MYVSVRGWLEVNHKQRDVVEAIIADAQHELYSGGWAFPRAPFNWSLCVFYGGDLRVAQLDWLRAQVESLAAMEAVDNDGDMPVGVFMLIDEIASVAIWEVRDGAVHERIAPEFAWLDRE